MFPSLSIGCCVTCEGPPLRAQRPPPREPPLPPRPLLAGVPDSEASLSRSSGVSQSAGLFFGGRPKRRFRKTAGSGAGVAGAEGGSDSGAGLPSSSAFSSSPSCGVPGSDPMASSICSSSPSSYAGVFSVERDG